MKQSIQIMVKSFLLLFCSVSLSLAATVTVVPSGGNSYAVEGGGMDGVAGIELNISYDASSLSAPSVSQGALVGSAMFISNANNPGSIKIAVITTTVLKGSGRIATIAFGSQTGSGSVAGINAKLIDITGKAMPVIASIASTDTKAPLGDGPATSGSVSAATDSTPAATGMSSSLGSINMPSDAQQSVAAAPAATPAAAPAVQAQPEAEIPKTEKRPDLPAAVAEPAVTAAEPAPVQVVYSGIMERFRTHQGARTPAAMTELFQKPVAGSIRQQPAIVVSDGKSVFSLIADLPAGNAISPNFALSGARMISLKKGEVPGRWVVEAMPAMNVSKVSVTILQGGSVYEFPVTVVPPMSTISGKEADFAIFLKDDGVKPPKFDLNGDAKHDYLDDYIYTAHYLLLKNAGRK